MTNAAVTGLVAPASIAGLLLGGASSKQSVPNGRSTGRSEIEIENDTML
jgi:hypothetical protein